MSIESVRAGTARLDFPLINHRDIIFLDSAATTHKPQSVIDALVTCYAYEYAPVHRGIYRMAEELTARCENVREQIAHYLGVLPQEIVFTSGATASINIVAQAWALHMLKPGDEVVLSELEHHANIVPWMQVAQKVGAYLRWIPATLDWQLDIHTLDTIITEKTKLVSITLDSNIVGPLHPEHIRAIIERAHAVGARVLCDAAQAIAHQRLWIPDIGCDMLVFSGHKMYGPTGVGVLCLTEKMHHELATAFTGGGMVTHVDFMHAQWREMPYRLEAGTPPIAQIIGLGAALTYLQAIDARALVEHEASLCKQLITELDHIPGTTILGNRDLISQHGHIVSFTLQGFHPHDVAAYLAEQNICVRAGTHCAQPAHIKRGLAGSIRASVAVYTSSEEIMRLAYALKTVTQ